MKLSDVALQLQLLLPKYTDYFSKTIGIESISALGGVATIKTNSPHNLSTEEGATISNVAQINPLTGVSIDGLVFTFTTEFGHDLTLDYPGYEAVQLGGFAEPEWNDSFELVSVQDRNTFSIRSTNALPAITTGQYLFEIRMDGINGRKEITVVDQLTIQISGDFNDGDYIGGEVKVGVRIAGTVDIERALAQYTKQDADDLWMFVVANNATVSKDRTSNSDATSTIASGQDVRLRIIDSFSLFIVKGVKDDIAAVKAMDIARHDLLSPILKSVFGARFTTGTEGDADFGAVLVGHNWTEYNRATFVYQYTFEFSSDITTEDMVDKSDTRAFFEVEVPDI